MKIWVTSFVARLWQAVAGYGRIGPEAREAVAFHDTGFETTMAEHGIYWDITERYRKEGQIYDEPCTHATCAASNLSHLCAWSQDAP